MNVIFLDIDGVINLEPDWCIESINVLNRIIEKTDSKIVLTSDWRYSYSLAELRNIFAHNKILADIIDTIELYSNTNIDSLEKDRVLAILAYVNAHHIDHYLIIDDLDLGKHGIANDRFVQTRFSAGLKEEGLYELCIEILNNQ